VEPLFNCNEDFGDFVMKYDEFIKHVQSFAQLDSHEAAEQATRATLETVAERIVGDEASQLAAQLPSALGQYLRGREGQNGGTFSLKEFYERVSQREGVEPLTATLHVRAVFAVLNMAVTPGEFQDVRANFSQDYDELFATPGKI
jgi:uncharacterized protein (DUF2267 family)